MKNISVKDFIIGALTVTLFFMLLGAAQKTNTFGRFVPSVGATQSWGIVCVTDTLTGSTRCDTKWPKESMSRDGGMFDFTPDFSKK